MTTFIREWIVPTLTTALVAWIVIPVRPPVSDSYATNALAEHRSCALERQAQRRQGASLSPADFANLIPDFGGRIRVVEAHHPYATSMDFTHVIVEERDGRRASILIGLATEGGERVIGPQARDGFEVSQVRTTRHHAVIVIDPDRARALRDWRTVTLERLQRSFQQLEGTATGVERVDHRGASSKRALN